jgi:putative oxygen-independent coproporphyrinogen III oxidase
MSRVARRPGPVSGIYIHIPYCMSKCAYCSFNSYETACGVPGDYIEALLRDMARESPRWEGVEFGSVYLGGGTPSLLAPADLGRVLSAVGRGFRLSHGAEVTLEANPSSLSGGKMDGYREAGVNRLSVGVQSLAAEELALLGRVHSPQEALDSLEAAAAAGYESLSCDVIVGVPGQTPASLEATVSGLAPLASHVSGYLLSVDAGTRLRWLVQNGTVREQSDGDAVALLETMRAGMERHGFARYEISNWARPGLECRHNLMYWSRGDYVGVGAGACSHRRGERCRRLSHPEAYTREVLSGGDPVDFRETVTPAEAVLEEVMLRLRTIRGLDLARLAADHHCALEGTAPLLHHLSAEGLVVRNGKEIQLSPRGMLVSDAVIRDLTAALVPC